MIREISIEINNGLTIGWSCYDGFYIDDGYDFTYIYPRIFDYSAHLRWIFSAWKIKEKKYVDEVPF